MSASNLIDSLPDQREMIATHKQMFEANLPLHIRDYCAHLAIPLNECRGREMWLPWKCAHEKHEYERCLYKDYLYRKAQQMELDRRAAELQTHEGQAAANK